MYISFLLILQFKYFLKINIYPHVHTGSNPVVIKHQIKEYMFYCNLWLFKILLSYIPPCYYLLPFF